MSTSRMSKADPLSKKVPQNPKYKNVRAMVDTGASITKYMQKIEDIRKNYRFRNNEIFKRMKISTFVQLVCQVCQFDFNLQDIDSNQDFAIGDAADNEILAIQEGSTREMQSVEPTESIPETTRSTLHSVIGGTGELDLNRGPQPPKNVFVNDESPYLLLDMRDNDEYNECHIITAHSYPKALLSRATNYETKDMLKYKNAEGKIIVIYDEDERIATIAATTLVQRGYDNLFMLSGGLKVAFKLFPQCLICGTIPGSITGKKKQQGAPINQKFFTQEDIDSLLMYLDTVLQDNSSGSRLSKASTATSRSSARSVSSTVSDKPPFR